LKRSGISARSRSNSSGVRIRTFRGITFGSSVSAQGLCRMTRSRTARLKTPCSITWYFMTLRGERPSADALVTHACTNDGLMDDIARLPKKGMKCRSR
jgi:hypothetical protein